MSRSQSMVLADGWKGAIGLVLLAMTAIVFGNSVRAETVARLDAMSQATDRPASGIALARRQIRNGELLEAMATLERVLMHAPDNLEARALHAGLLCRIDDRRGAVLEFDMLRGLDVPQAIAEEARQPCGKGN
ncbi:MAG: hypothetical protein N2423_01850 [Novosphingobium sp.]|nr:hypothetical protein [Novosphingobium sp.]